MPGAVEPELDLRPVLGVLANGDEIGDTTSSSDKAGRAVARSSFESERERVIPCDEQGDDRACKPKGEERGNVDDDED